ncbi:hypothetical protein B0T24DRAFT_676288 [Lasiosphaeria ovina]|uniref:Nudix hydrolase domain-containing protein n=1 Tax=Lasiosphaeria ovina TaxID=92902 RepID=A0AAE0NFL3_9PEZI|nr:hypothetical protein B0T24DRAFT_676288 [Lasiosphaeria ovina]
MSTPPTSTIASDPAIDASTLLSSRSSFLSHTTVPPPANAPTSSSGSLSAPHILLLLQRAAHETYFPSVSEIPGGKVDESDSGVAAAAVREVREETGPRVARFAAQLRLMLCTTSKAASSSAGVVSKRAIQPNYVVAVDWVGDGEVVLSEDEHAGFVWAAEDELDGLDMTVRTLNVDQRVAFQDLKGH